MGKKKKGGKKGVVEGLPLEDYLTQEMNTKEIKKFAVKLGAALRETKNERTNLELDRDKMLRNLINVVCRLFMTNREVRRLDREIINKKNLCEREVLQKENELAEIRFKQTSNFFRSKSEIFVSGYECVNNLFHKQDQMFKDCISLNNDYYKKYLEQEIAFMTNKHISLCDKIDRVNENYLDKLLRIERKYYRRSKQATERENQNKANTLRDVIQKKETIIENVQREHLSESVDILRSFEDIIKFNFSIINELREDLSDIKNNALKVTREFRELKEKYQLYCSSVKQAHKELSIIRPVVYYLHHTKAAALTFSKKCESTEEETMNARLEVELLEDFIRKDDEWDRKLKQIVINDLLSFRQMQVKTHLFMMNLGNKIEEMYADRVRIGKLALFSLEPEAKSFQDVYQRYECYRRSAVDIVERVLRANFSQVSSLGFHLREPPAVGRTALPALGPRPLPRGHGPPRMLDLIKTLPRVPTRKTTEHLAPHLQVLKAPCYIGSVKMTF